MLGVDACRAGWVSIAWSGGAIRAYVAPDIDQAVALATADGPVDVIAVDIPIGLADNALRQADLLARRAAGARWASVFVTPVRPALLVDNYGAASALNRRLTGAGATGLLHVRWDRPSKASKQLLWWHGLPRLERSIRRKDITELAREAVADERADELDEIQEEAEAAACR